MATNVGSQIISQNANIYYIGKKINLKQTYNMEWWRIGIWFERAREWDRRRRIERISKHQLIDIFATKCDSAHDRHIFRRMVSIGDVDKFTYACFVSIYYILSITYYVP